ncbi:MAG: chloride channel protein [Prolixibacteraceae bacterium]|nr:chloride channel protein [Prolixibacteraceae bacterium]
MKGLTNSLRRFNIWRVKRIPERSFVLFLSFVVGLVSGLAAVLLKNLIHFSIEMLEDNFLSRGAYLYLIFPILGITITYLFVKHIIKDNIGHGVTRVLYAISKNNSFLKPHNTWSSMLASTITISFGGSVGAEAPVVLTGSAIGSNLARLFKLNYRQITLMLGCGAAGAVAGIFKAPLAGLLFTIEVLMLDLTMASLVPLMISAVTATTVAYFLMGNSVLFTFSLDNAFTVENIGYYIVLGLFCGLISVYFTRITLYAEKFFKNINRQWKKILFGGGLLTLLVFVFPSLWGEGYNSINTIIHGNGSSLLQNTLLKGIADNSILFLLTLFLVLLLKVIAMAATNGAGGVGGIFAPSLLVGSFAGYFLVASLNHFFMLQLPESNFALAGMAGVMAGVMHAPMTAIFLIAEITGGYDLFLPLIITGTISYITIMLFEPHSIYTKRLAMRGELLTHHKDKNVLIMLNTEKLVEKEFVVINENFTLRDFVKKVPESKRNIFPVLDDEEKLVGVVLMENVRPVIFNRELYDSTMITDFMIAPPAVVETNESMESVMKKFNASKAWNLPVTQNGKYIGFLSKSKIFNEYRDMLIHFSDE